MGYDIENQSGKAESEYMNETIAYYNHHADTFVDGTLNADMSSLYALFEKYCRPNSKILDFGCGSGRDTKHFLEKGYQVDAIDGSEELCKIASEHTGIHVRQMYFNELDADQEYDGIWACASLLHVAKEDLPGILGLLSNALVEGGILYLSFKYGSFSGVRNGRFFTDLTEESFLSIVSGIPSFCFLETAITGDVRAGHEERWLNLVLKKV